MVSREEVLHVARLAKLALGEDELERAARQLGRILEYVEMLRELDEESLAEANGEPDVPRQPLRTDTVRDSLPRADVMALSPRTDGETFLVPPVIDGGGGA